MAQVSRSESQASEVHEYRYVKCPVQRAELVSLGCGYCQGYYFARPMPASDLSTLVAHTPPKVALHLPVPASISA